MTIPQSTLESIDLYVGHGLPPGDFLTAVLCNDLKRAVAHADSYNAPALAEIVKYLYNHIPTGAWGSEDNFREWRAAGGMSGRDRT